MRAPSVPTKDQKILWARAAGLCSMAECRDALTLDGSSQDVHVLGEMCHVVGESADGPRGKSPTPIEERSLYSNLILLCTKHHTIIDKDVARYPVEVLHAIKDKHEQWVSETLSRRSADPDPDDLVYADLVDTITAALQLDQWTWFIDSAVRELLHEDFVDARGILNQKLLATLWPRKKKKLEAATQALIHAFSDYITHFLSNAELRGPGHNHFTADHSYARFQNPKRQEHEERERRWSSASFWLLCEFVIRLNAFCAAVRAAVNPLYFRLRGAFLIEDSMGVHFGGEPTLFKPTRTLVLKKLAKADLPEEIRARLGLPMRSA